MGQKHVDLGQGLYAAPRETVENWADYIAEFCRDGLGVSLKEKAKP